MEALGLVRILVGRLALGAVGVLGVLASPTDAQTWPLQNGSHDILHSFQNPFYFSSYFHEGVDIRGDLDAVVAVRGGTVRYVNQADSGGTLLVEVVTPSGIEADSYLHVQLDPWNAGDPIDAGDVIGLVSNSYFFQTNQHHVHVNRFDGYAGGNGYVFNRTNMLNPLLVFGSPTDRDPQVLPAGPQDANLDGVTFEIVAANSNGTVLPFPYGRVDILLEATDRLTSTLFWNQGLTGVGYWIEAKSGGTDVRSATTPYRLLRFDDAWRSSHAAPDSLVTTALMSSFGRTVQFGPDNTQWTSLATYKLTNTSGTQGLGSDIEASQAWRTGGKAGTATQPNGDDGLPALEIHEAMFPDGRYVVHTLTEDLHQEIDTEHPVVVDNFRPYVERVRASIREALIHQGAWTYDDASKKLSLAITSLRPRFDGPGDLVIEVLFSEPMQAAELSATAPSVGFLPTLTSAEPLDNRRTWTGAIPAKHLARLHQGRTLRLSFTGTDLNGSTLHEFSGTAPVTAPFNKRGDSTPWNGATTDSLHVITMPDLADHGPPLLDGGKR